MTTSTAPCAAARVRSADLRGAALGVVGVVGVLLLWELASRLGLIDARFFPPASEVLVRLGEYVLDRAFWRDVAATMSAWSLGLVIAIVAGTLVGFVLGGSRFLERFTHSTIEFLRPIPSVALVPLAVLLFGTKVQSELLLVVYASIWPVLLQVLSGTKDVDPVADATARSYGLNRWQRIRSVVWPTTLPYLVTGIRLAASIALILAITAEMIIQTPGLGKQIILTREGGDALSMYALILATGLIGVAVNAVMRFIERRVLSWHQSVRMETVA